MAEAKRAALSGREPRGLPYGLLVQVMLYESGNLQAGELTYEELCLITAYKSGLNAAETKKRGS